MDEGGDRDGSAESGRWTPDRRALLGGVAAAASASAGCVQRAQDIMGWKSPDDLSLTVKTVPADADEAATSIARALTSNLSAVGIDAELQLLGGGDLYRDVLINHEFDLYVAQLPAYHDPDFLRPLLHSTFNDDRGWLNPFGYSDLDVDRGLEKQRLSAGSRRREVVNRLQRDIVQTQPFTVVALPDTVLAVRPDRFAGWDGVSLDEPVRLLGLRAVDPVRKPGGSGGRRASQLRLVTTDGGPTEGLNPLTVHSPNGVAFTDLVYDPLARRFGGEVKPWLAADTEWTTTGDGRPRATVRLRDGARWHDGRPLTARDVAFTYRFLADTSLGRQEQPVPAPRYHGQVSLVESATAPDERTARITFGQCSRPVARRALTVPVLPRHVWRPKAQKPNLAGVDVKSGQTEALVWDNPKPVGSGPLRFERRVAEEMLALSRNDQHFLADRPVTGPASRFEGGAPFDRLSLRIAPSSAAAVELVGADRADATATTVNPDAIPAIGRHDALRLHATRSRAFYHVGFNTTQPPLSNVRFRRAIARLLDKQHLVRDVFDGYATPADSALAGTDWLSSSLRWTPESPALPFFGENGQLDVEQAREAFREAGYRYDEDGGLVGR